MSTVVHHASMYAVQKQAGTGSTVLAAKVTPVTGGPATFAGIAPSNKKELDNYSVANDFSSGSAAAWANTQWVNLGKGRFYTWNGTAWVTSNVGTGVSASVGGERTFTGGRSPATPTELSASAFGQVAAWAGGDFITLGGKSSGGEKYFWNGTAWVVGVAP